MRQMWEQNQWNSSFPREWTFIYDYRLSAEYYSSCSAELITNELVSHLMYIISVVFMGMMRDVQKRLGVLNFLSLLLSGHRPSLPMITVLVCEMEIISTAG